jgi:hypothetical protein
MIPVKLALKVRMVTTIILSSPKRRNHVRTSLLIKFTRRIRLLAIIEEIQRSLIISNATLLITDGRLDFHFHTVFLSDTPPSIYNANPRLMTPPRSVTRELLKKWLNSEKNEGPQNVSATLTHFGVTRTGAQNYAPKSGFRLVLLTDPDWLQKIAKKYLPAKKMLAWDGDIWLEVTDFFTHEISWVKKNEKKWKKVN